MGPAVNMIRFAMHGYQEDSTPIQFPQNNLVPHWGILSQSNSTIYISLVVTGQFMMMKLVFFLPLRTNSSI